MPHFKLFSSCVCSHFGKWGASRAGEDRTLENSQQTDCDAAEWKRYLHEYAIDCEEDRLQHLEIIAELKRSFGSRQCGTDPQKIERIRAGGRAIRLLEAILQDDEEQMILALDVLAFHLGYRIKKGRFDD